MIRKSASQWNETVLDWETKAVQVRRARNLATDDEQYARLSLDLFTIERHIRRIRDIRDSAPE